MRGIENRKTEYGPGKERIVSPGSTILGHQRAREDGLMKNCEVPPIRNGRHRQGESATGRGVLKKGAQEGPGAVPTETLRKGKMREAEVGVLRVEKGAMENPGQGVAEFESTG